MTDTNRNANEESEPRERLMIHTLSDEPVTIDEYLRRLRDGTEPRPTPERAAEAWARRHAPEGATEEEIAALADSRLPHQIRVSALAQAFAESYRVHGPDGMWRGEEEREKARAASMRGERVTRRKRS